jgi:Squalene-hopene cyclase C-terminal domain
MQLVTREMCIGWLLVGAACTGCHMIAGKELSLLPQNTDSEVKTTTGGDGVRGDSWGRTPTGDNEQFVTAADVPTYSETAIRAAVERAHAVLWKGIEGHAGHRECFTCHTHGTPMLAFATARAQGFAVPEKEFADLIEFSTAYFESNRERFLRGRGPGPLSLGGATDTTGWGLFALEVAGKQPDSTTAAMVEYTLQRDQDRDHWTTWGPSRPPAEGSAFMPTALAIRGLQAFGLPEQRERIAKRVEAAREWLLRTPAHDTEDRIYRLLGLQSAGAQPEDIRRAVADLVRTQRADGGWGQTDAMASDPYATGSALTALQIGGGMPVTEPVYRRGVAYLLRTQLDDGSWLVRSRSFPVQPYYESGFPHGRNQFISTAATGWAATALTLACARDCRPGPLLVTQTR